MQVRWSTAATQDLFQIIEYIRRENAPAAQRVANAIYENISSLSSFPQRGRVGRLEGTRELPVPSLPFLVVYRVTQDAVEIAGVIHGAQRWPPEG
jgi:toxin ParE1/3/4